MKEYKIGYEANPKQNDIEVIENGLEDFDRTEFGRSGNIPLTFFLRDSHDSVVGGVHGNTGATWAYIRSLWVSEQLRGTGYGGRLLRTAEEKAVSRGCSNCYLDTFNPRALEFYLKAGYVIFGELEEFLQGQKRYFLRKKLA